MIIATMMPAMMQSAYARNGSPKTSQTPVLGLGMDSATDPAPLIAWDSRGSRLVDLGLQRFRCQVSEVEGGTVEKQRRRAAHPRSEEHTSELQSRQYLVCRLLLEKKKKKKKKHNHKKKKKKKK